LESMIKYPRPTRAEATDIASAVQEGADAIMLSGETAVGSFPLLAVKALDLVIKEAERTPPLSSLPHEPLIKNLSDVVIREACHMADRLKTRWIIVPIRTGKTAVRVSSFRPRTRLMALGGGDVLRRSLSLHWGIQSETSGRISLPAHVPAYIRAFLMKKSLVKKGDRVLLLSWVPGLKSDETGRVEFIQIP